MAFADEFLALQNPVDGAHRQTDLLLGQQHLQFLRAPAGLLTQRYDALLFRSFRQAWTVMRPAAAFLQRTQTARIEIAPAPVKARGPRNRELPAQRRQRFLTTHRSNHEPHPLLVHIHLVPRHRLQPPGPETLTLAVKDVLATTVKDVMAPYVKDRPLHFP